MLLSVWLSDWLDLRSPAIRPRTRESYADLISRYINPSIGSVDLNDLDAVCITHLLASISASGHSRTSELCYVLLKLALRDAPTESSPMRLVKRPRHVQQTPEAWSDAQIAAYLPAMARHRHRLGFSLAIFLGLRRGEICGLRWEDVDFSTNQILIRNQRQRLASGKVVDCPPKSESSVRSLPIPPQLLPLLRSQRQISGYLVPISPSGLNQAHRALVKSLSIPYIPLHGLRHTMATSCIRHGGDMKSLQLVLGHASYATTANRYTHPDQSMLAAAIDCAAAIRYNA